MLAFQLSTWNLNKNARPHSTRTSHKPVVPPLFAMPSPAQPLRVLRLNRDVAPICRHTLASVTGSPRRNLVVPTRRGYTFPKRGYIEGMFDAISPICMLYVIIIGHQGCAVKPVMHTYVLTTCTLFSLFCAKVDLCSNIQANPPGAYNRAAHT